MLIVLLQIKLLTKQFIWHTRTSKQFILRAVSYQTYHNDNSFPDSDQR